MTGSPMMSSSPTCQVAQKTRVQTGCGEWAGDAKNVVFGGGRRFVNLAQGWDSFQI